MKRQAALTSALLSVLFIVVYPTCNWLASRRADVGTWYFPWEQHIPFVPWMIIPYCSIDLLFVCAPFVCREGEELRVLAKRMATAILAAGACFIAFPLHIVFPRPEVHGVPGAMFNLLHAFDQPHNLFPSLHIALWMILWPVYVGHTRGSGRLAVKIWFALIALSTVLTWQHQVIDVAGGVALAVLCLYLFRETPLVLPVTHNYRIAAY